MANADSAATVAILYGDGQGGYSAPSVRSDGYGQSDVAIAELNEDGALDIITVSQWDNEVSLFLSDGKGDFLPQEGFAAGSSPVALAIADVNADGSLDVVGSISRPPTPTLPR